MLNLANRLTAMQGQRLSRADAAIQNSTVPKGYTGCENECKIWWIQIQLNLAQNVRSNWISIWKPHSPTATARISRSGFTLLPHHLFFVQISLFSRKTSARDMLASVWVGVNINFFFLTIHDSYELLPISLTGLGGVDRFELLFEPRLCRGDPSRLQSWNKKLTSNSLIVQ